MVDREQVWYPVDLGSRPGWGDCSFPSLYLQMFGPCAPRPISETGEVYADLYLFKHKSPFKCTHVYAILHSASLRCMLLGGCTGVQGRDFFIDEKCLIMKEIINKFTSNNENTFCVKIICTLLTTARSPSCL